MTPTRLSKINTFFEFGVLLLVMANAAAWFDASYTSYTSSWLPPVFVLVLATVVASGAHYIWVWGRKAARASRGTCRTGT